jgi:hypothetical protein
MKQMAILGAGGKMGYRISAKLMNNADYDVKYVEISETGIKRLNDLGLAVVPMEEAVKNADIVLLAIPDVLIGKITLEVVPGLKPGCMVYGLDPAAAYAGVMPVRNDLTFFVAHPTHPGMFNYAEGPDAQKDYFGGTAKQSVVCALYQGPEEDYAVGESIAREIYAPVIRTHRITIEQMAVLEPGLVETFTSTLIEAMKEAFDRCVEMGVPKEAAMDFFMGHARIQFAVLFGYADFNFSDGALLAMRQARDLIFKPDWKEKIFNIDAIKKSVLDITHAIQK